MTNTPGHRLGFLCSNWVADVNCSTGDWLEVRHGKVPITLTLSPEWFADELSGRWR